MGNSWCSDEPSTTLHPPNHALAAGRETWPRLTDLLDETRFPADDFLEVYLLAGGSNASSSRSPLGLRRRPPDRLDRPEQLFPGVVLPDPQHDRTGRPLHWDVRICRQSKICRRPRDSAALPGSMSRSRVRIGEMPGSSLGPRDPSSRAEPAAGRALGRRVGEDGEPEAASQEAHHRFLLRSPRFSTPPSTATRPTGSALPLLIHAINPLHSSGRDARPTRASARA